MKDVIGRWVGGMSMYKYGLPYRNAGGFIFADDDDLVDSMLAAVERHPELHVVTYLKGGWVLNRYESENANVYYLYFGNADPEIEFSTEYRLDDWTQEELEKCEKWLEEFRNRKTTVEEVAAVNFALNAVMTGKS
jgi:hypothetical protein